MTDLPTRVFVDANIFIGDRRPPGGPAVNALNNLVQSGKIRIISTDVTVNEISKHFTTHDLRYLSPLGRDYVRELVAQVFDVDLNALSHDEIKDALWSRNSSATLEMLGRLEANVLSVESVNPAVVLGEYSMEVGMYKGGAKKDQFPDAFIFACLVTDAEKNGPLTILSKDDDFEEVCQDSDNLVHIKSLENLLSVLGLQVSKETLEKFSTSSLDTFFEERNNELLRLSSNLIEDFDIYSHDNLDAEIYDVQVIYFQPVQMLEFGLDEHEVLISGEAEIEVEFGFTAPDFSNATYDSEDKVLLIRDHITGTKTSIIPIEFRMTVRLDEDKNPLELCDFSLVSDGDISVDIENDDYY